MNNPEQANNYVRQSREYYQRATEKYRGLIAQGRDLDKWYLELGHLYYSHGDFEQAIEALRKSNAALAKKYLAVSYYRSGNFTDALEIFN